jgi:hypothetical protein
MNLTRRNFVLSSTGSIGALALVGCGNTQSDLTLALTALEGAAETALTTLLATNGISQSEFGLANSYLTEVTTFVDFVEMEVNSTATVLQKSAAIEQEATTLGLKSIPPGLPSIILSVFNAVLQEITSVLSTTATTTSLLLSHGVNSFDSQKKWSGKLSRKDKMALADVARRNTILKGKLKK